MVRNSRNLSSGRLRPVSGRNSMNMAMIIASVLCVLVRFPRLFAKALIYSGGSWRASTPTSWRLFHMGYSHMSI